MTIALDSVRAQVGSDVTAALAAYLREAHADAWFTAIRRTLADLLGESLPPADAPDVPDERLVAVVGTWAASVPQRELSPVSYWLRQQTTPRPSAAEASPAGRLFAALAAEVDVALGVAILTPDVTE